MSSCSAELEGSTINSCNLFLLIWRAGITLANFRIRSLAQHIGDDNTCHCYEGIVPAEIGCKDFPKREWSSACGRTS